MKKRRAAMAARFELPGHPGYEQHGSVELPGVEEAGMDDEIQFASLTLEAKGTVGEGGLEIQPAAVAEVEVQGTIDCDNYSETLPLAVTAVAGLMRGVAGRHVVPGGMGAKFPEDAVEDEALVEEGAATASSG